MQGPELPPGYRLDQSQADFVFLLRLDGSRVAVFNAWSTTAEHITQAAREDLRGPYMAAADAGDN